MPMFEYRCKKCDHVTEVLERAGDRSKPKCEKCGSLRMEKLLAAFSVGKGQVSSSSSCPTGTCPLS